VSRIIEALSERRRGNPATTAICGVGESLSYEALADRVDQAVAHFRNLDCRCVAILADNSVDWVVADLAAVAAGIAMIPLPPFFTADQLNQLFATTPVDTLLVDDSIPLATTSPRFDATSASIGSLAVLRRARPAVLPPAVLRGVAKITFTSGSTGTPKGVCLARVGLEQTAGRLAKHLGDIGIRRHLCVMPLATLLENVAGIYVSILLGAVIHVWPMRAVGLSGSSRLDVATLRRAIDETRAESIILIPQMLQELAAYARGERWEDCPLRFVAVGGAKISDHAIDAAVEAGIPVYQGYGLSECNSVVALNRPAEHRRSSVGKPLVDDGVRIAEDGEIIVNGSRMLCYLGESPTVSDEIATGDIGHLDADGYLYITGRKKNLFITSFGRNVSPEWPEAELVHQPEIRQAVVFGEGMPGNVAVLVPSGNDGVEGAVQRANSGLPDYAQVNSWIIADEPFTTGNGLLTPTGKPRREAVMARYLPTPQTAACS